jgi:hypothetical protein
LLIYCIKFDKNVKTQKPRKDIRKRFDLRDKPRSPVNTHGDQIITLQAEWTSTKELLDYPIDQKINYFTAFVIYSLYKMCMGV